jgi:hypothetical protein
MSNWLALLWIWIQGVSVIQLLSILFVWRIGWRAAIRIMTGVGDLVQRTGDGQAQVGYSVLGWSSGRVTMCSVCTVHVKTGRYSLVIWASKSPRRFFVWASKPSGLRFVGWTTKPLRGWRWRGSSSFLRLEASKARIFQSGLKTGGGATRMVHVTLSQRSCRVQVEDGRVDAMGRIRPFYPYFVVFIVLGPRGILVFSLGL